MGLACQYIIATVGDLSIPERMWGIKIPRPRWERDGACTVPRYGARVRIFPLSSEIAIILALSQFRRGGIK